VAPPHDVLQHAQFDYFGPGEDSSSEAHWMPNTKRHNPDALSGAQFDG
jgi:hypothetical protein